MQIIPQIDWSIVPPREAFYFGVLVGGIAIWFGCLFLHLWLSNRATAYFAEREKRIITDSALRVANAYRRGAERSAGIHFAQPKHHLTAFLAVDHATRIPTNPRSAFLE